MINLIINIKNLQISQKHTTFILLISKAYVMKTTNSIIGLFIGGHKPEKIQKSLTIGGISPESIATQEIDHDVYAVSVSIDDQYEEQMVHNIFEFHLPKKIYPINFRLKASELRDYIKGRALSHINESDIIRKRPPIKGMNSEVEFG